MHRPFIVFMLLSLAGCPSTPHTPPPTGENCTGAHRRLLECEAQGYLLLIRTKKGETYEQVCLRVEKGGKIPTGATCIVQAPTCEGVVECQQN